MSEVTFHFWKISTSYYFFYRKQQMDALKRFEGANAVGTLTQLVGSLCFCYVPFFGILCVYEDISGHVRDNLLTQNQSFELTWGSDGSRSTFFDPGRVIFVWLRLGQPLLGLGKFSLKIPSDHKNLIGSGKKYPGQRQVSFLSNGGQKYVRVWSGSISYLGSRGDVAQDLNTEIPISKHWEHWQFISF